MDKRLLIWIIGMFVLNSLVSAHNYNVTHYYTFDGTLEDSTIISGATRNLFTVGEFTPEYSVGYLGQSYDSLGRTLTNRTFSGNPSISYIHTIDFWVYTNETRGSIFSLGGSVCSQDFVILFIDDELAVAHNGWVLYSQFKLQNFTWYNVIININNTNKSLYINGVLNDSIAMNGNGMVDGWNVFNVSSKCTGDESNIRLDNLAFFNDNYSISDVEWSYNGGLGRNFLTGAPLSNPLQITLESPPDDNINNSLTMNFTYNVISRSSSLKNCSLLFNGIINITNTSALNNNSNNNFSNVLLQNKDYNWSISCFDIEENSWNTTNRTLTIDSTPPFIIPINTLFNNQTIVWNGTLNTWINFSDNIEMGIVNITYGNKTTINYSSGNGENSYNVFIHDTIWETGLLNINVTACDKVNNCNESYFYFANINPNILYESFAFSGSESKHNLTVYNDSVVAKNINATIYYNATSYYAGATSNFSINISAPNITLTSSVVPFYWNISVYDQTYNLGWYNQTILNFGLDNCSNYTTVAINFTVYDENNGTQMPVDFTAVFNYIAGTVSRTYSLSQTDISQAKICISPSYATFAGSYSVYYQSATYPQRRYYDNTASYDNTTREIPLYVLDVSEGIYGRFAVIDNSNNPISNVTVTMSSSGLVREKQSTDSAGLATFWVDPDSDYTFVFSKVGYTSVTETLRVTTGDPYTVIMGGGAGQVKEYPYDTGIRYTFLPTGDLTNNTNYDFKFSMTSSYWTITGCTLYLQNDGTTLKSNSSYDTDSCDITINYNTGNYSTLTSKVIYNLNSSSDLTALRQYSIWDRYTGQFSLKNFIDDLTNFGQAGFDDFSRIMLSFIVIFIVVGGLAYKFADFREPEVLIIVVIGMVWFFSYIGWMTINYPTIPSTWLKKYILAIVISMAGGATVLKKVTD